MSKTPIAFLRQHFMLVRFDEDLRQARKDCDEKRRAAEKEYEARHKEIWDKVEAYAREQNLLPEDWSDKRDSLQLSKSDGVLYVIRPEEGCAKGGEDGDECECPACLIGRAISKAMQR